jgi:hypothetical protein
MGQISNYGKAKGPTSTGIFSYITDGVSVLVNGFGQVLQGLESYIAVLIVEVFLIPAFSVILTAVSIRELAKLLGTEINFGRFYWI